MCLLDKEVADFQMNEDRAQRVCLAGLAQSLFPRARCDKVLLFCV